MIEDKDATGLEELMGDPSWPTIKGMLARIHVLRDKAYIQPRHWDHTPSEAEMLREEEARGEAHLYLQDLNLEVERLREALLSPFVR